MLHDSIKSLQTYEPVRNAVALLVGTELWGFITPSTVDLSLVRAATAIVQPYYAVPSQYLAIDNFPTTRNGKVDKRALVGLAEGSHCLGQTRLSVRNGGVPFNPNLPGTPNSIHEQSSFKWRQSGSVSPLSSSSLSSSQLSSDSQCLADQEEADRKEVAGTPNVLDDVPRMVCVDAV